MNVTFEEIKDFCYTTHPELKGTLPEWKLRSILERYKRNIVVQRIKKEIKGISLYLKVSDRYFERIVNKDFTLEKIEDLFILVPFGNNIIFLGLVAEGIEAIRKGLTQVIKKENPKRIAWYRDHKNKFFIINRR